MVEGFEEAQKAALKEMHGSSRTSVAGLIVIILAVLAFLVILGPASSQEEDYLESTVLQNVQGQMNEAGIKSIAHERTYYSYDEDENGDIRTFHLCRYELIFEHEGVHFVEDLESECSYSELTITETMLSQIGLSSGYNVIVDPSRSEDTDYDAISLTVMRGLKRDLQTIISDALALVAETKKDIAENPM